MTETATPEVIPCPEEISLELGSDGQIVFVSDVHLTGGGPVADFDATTELVELLTELGRHEGEKLLLFGEGMVPVRAWFSLPPVFVAAYPCTWLALPKPGALRPDWTPGAATAEATDDPLGSQRWAGLPTASAGSAGAAPDEPAR